MFKLFFSEAIPCNAEYHTQGEKLGFCSHIPVPLPWPLRKISCGSIGKKGCFVAMKQQGKNNKISSVKAQKKALRNVQTKGCFVHLNPDRTIFSYVR